ncbi:hypothetical protein COY31_00850 [Candidatus Wolfebacteria bacterium CG_4_10_14_0_2_um_filter_39_18]|uniref:DUF1003 domain-containing protein n=1 Tax=Candidatus Wolfebacteria bacterium CG_4_10_14_0_2_um_filter_39_18 TaxID=1975061 RepID=A0A2M7TGI7_9BACT|nr:MAG: hypothetical protein COY31_00850 [Candidatus Wolfebacteria bacterium CG_4_10_14_0_2_um_filter_39_18]
MPKNINIQHFESLTRMEKFAVWITNHIGTMGFFLIVFFWTLAWIAWNIFSPKELKFDLYPAFTLWLFISNILQLFLLPLIMVGQNLQMRHAEFRAENDFEINLKAKKEIETILKKLELQDEKIFKILKLLEER